MAFTFPTNPNIGDSFYISGTRYFYTGTVWERAVKNVLGTRGTKTFTATSGQTEFQCSFSVDNSEVFIDGIKLDKTDYTVNDSGLVTLVTGAVVGSNVEVIGYGVYDILKTLPSGTISTTGTSTVIIDSFLNTDFRSSNYTVVVSSSSGFMQIKLSVLYINSDVILSSYDLLGSNLGDFDAVINSSNTNTIDVTFTPNVSATEVKFTKTSIENSGLYNSILPADLVMGNSIIDLNINNLTIDLNN